VQCCFVCLCRCKSKAVQTGLDIGLHYSWPRGSADAVASAQYGLAFVDPTSVASTVVSADALEGISSRVFISDILSGIYYIYCLSTVDWISVRAFGLYKCRFEPS